MNVVNPIVVFNNLNEMTEQIPLQTVQNIYSILIYTVHTCHLCVYSLVWGVYLSITSIGLSLLPPPILKASSSTSFTRSNTVERGEHCAGQLLTSIQQTSLTTPPV